MMKKILPAFAVLALLVAPIFVANAVTQATPPTAGATFTSISDLLDRIDSVKNWFFTAVMIIAVIFIIWAAFDFVTAGGNATQVTAARDRLINALIGVAVAVSALGLIEFVKNFIKTGN